MKSMRMGLSVIVGLFVLGLLWVDSSGNVYAQEKRQPITSTVDGGRGLVLTPSARTYGIGHFTASIQTLFMQREYPVSWQDEYEKNFPVVSSITGTVGLTEEVDVTLGFTIVNDIRPLRSSYNQFLGYGGPSFRRFEWDNPHQAAA